MIKQIYCESWKLSLLLKINCLVPPWRSMRYNLCKLFYRIMQTVLFVCWPIISISINMSHYEYIGEPNYNNHGHGVRQDKDHTTPEVHYYYCIMQWAHTHHIIACWVLHSSDGRCRKAPLLILIVPPLVLYTFLLFCSIILKQCKSK